MTSGGDPDPAAEYAAALSGYVSTRSEDALYRASLLSQRFVQQGLGPEDIIALHAGALAQVGAGLSFREQANASTDALQFLLEVMIAYGLNHRELLELRVQEQERRTGEQVAVQRDRAEEAERASRERAELIQVVVHELRTPLAVVKGSLDLARRALTRGQLDSLDRFATQAQEAVARLTRMANDLIEASRGTATPVALAPLDLRAAVAQAFAWATVSLAKDLEITGDVDGDGDPIPVLGDADGLASVFGNLLTNAIRYTPAGGRIAIRCYVAGDSAVVEVTDTGIGMAPETAARVFDQFYRAPEALAMEPRGLGLGLALVHQLVDAHGGTISVHSALGAGSTFRVTLPILRDGLLAPKYTPDAALGGITLANKDVRGVA